MFLWLYAPAGWDYKVKTGPVPHPPPCSVERKSIDTINVWISYKFHPGF